MTIKPIEGGYSAQYQHLKATKPTRSEAMYALYKMIRSGG